MALRSGFFYLRAGFEALWAKGFDGGPFTGIHAGVAFTFVFSGPARPASETVAAR